MAVAVAGMIAGAAIAGLPDDDESLELSAVTTTTTTLADVDIASTQPATTAVVDTTVVDTTVVTTTVAASSPVVPEPSTTVASTTPASTTSASTTSASTTSASTTSASTSPATNTTLVDQLLERVDVSIVLANGDGRFNLVGRNADRLLALGYVEIDQTDVGDRPPATIIYYRPGFDDEAERLAGDLQTPNATITALPDTPVTGNDAAGELVVVLGPDALR